MNNEPVAWVIDVNMTDCGDNFIWNTGDYPDWQVKNWIPLYTHPHPDNLGFAESIIKQQELEIERLKTIIEAYKIRPRGKSEFAYQTHLGVYSGEK